MANTNLFLSLGFFLTKITFFFIPNPSLYYLGKGKDKDNFS